MNSSSAITIEGQFKNNSGQWQPIEVTDNVRHFYTEKVYSEHDQRCWVKHTNRGKTLSILVKDEEYKRVTMLLRSG